MSKPRTEIELATPEFPLVGWHVMYRISRVAIPFDDLKALLDRHGFGTFVPQPPATRTALHRAVADWVDRLAASGDAPARADAFSAEADEDGEEHELLHGHTLSRRRGPRHPGPATVADGGVR